MKALITLIISLMLIGWMTGLASAQNAVSGSASQANNTAEQTSTAVAGAYNGGIVQNYPAQRAETTQRIESAPAVSAPAVFGGGHPCLAGKSGGVSVIGGGLSYGQGNPEPACMAWVMGQPEVAIRIMMNTNVEFCEAMNSVGYYRVGKAVVPVECGKNKRTRGGVDSPGVASYTTKVSTRNQSNLLPQAVCNRSGGKLKYSVDAHFANQKSARQNCLNRLR